MPTLVFVHRSHSQGHSSARRRLKPRLVGLLLIAIAITIWNGRATTLVTRDSLGRSQPANATIHLVNTRKAFAKAANSTAPSPTDCCGGEEGNDNPHLLAASYYTLNNGFSAKLLLNNKGPHPIDVQPTLYSLAGERLNIPTVTVGANTHRFIDLREWTSESPQFKEGSIQLFHRGKNLVLGTQIYLTDEIHSLSFDEKLTELGSGSQRLEGVWWLPSPRGKVSLAISNTTDAAVCVVINVQGEKPRKSADATIDLRPHEMRLIDVETELLQREHGAMSEYGAISVTHGGTPGAVLARAMAFETAKGYSLPIQFANPAAAKSQNLQGTGLRVAPIGTESLSAKVVVHNASQIEQTLNGSVPFTISDGSSTIAQLLSLQLFPSETRVIDVTEALRSQGISLDQIVSAGLEFQHTGELGSLISSAFSVSESNDQVFRMPIWDVAAQRSATGGYPWYIDSGSSTVVYIKNTTDKPRSSDYI